MKSYLDAAYQLHALLRRAFWDAARLRKFQNAQLRALVRHAYQHVPFYHRQFRDLGLRPADIASTADLTKLPILRKSDIRQSREAILSTGVSPTGLRRLSTSGSTGEPLFIYVSGAESAFRKAKHLRANISCGQRPFDRWVTITAPHHFAESMRLQRLLNLFSPCPISVFSDVEAQVRRVAALQPDVLDGYSSSLLLLAKAIERQAIHTITPRFLIGGAELIDAVSRRYIEVTLQAPFYDQYSTVEFERMAWQCPAKGGYHMDVDAVALEFVDAGGEEVAVGESGEILCTSLFNYAMPFIRYAVGDMGVKSDETCPCGRGLPLMDVVEGRKDSLLQLPDGRTLTPRAFTIAFNMFQRYSAIDQFRVVQKQRDRFHVLVKLKAAQEKQAQRLCTELVAHLRKMIGLPASSVTFDVEVVDAIPLDPTGKLMTVKSEL